MLNFTNEQIKNISKDIILLPEVIHTGDNSYEAQKAGVLASKESLDKADNDIAVFSDHWIDVISKYHEELEYLTSEKRTNYLNSNITDSGNKNGPHFPTSPYWSNFNPKMIDSNNGNPRSVSSFMNEEVRISKVLPVINHFRNGFNYGSYSGSGVVAGNTVTSPNITGLAVGQLLLITSSSRSMIVKIESIVLGDPGSSGPPAVPATDSSVTFSLLYGSLFSGNVTLRNNFSGFTNNQRAGSVTITPFEDIFEDFKSKINDLVFSWKEVLSLLQITLIAQSDLPPRKSSNQLALNSVITLLSSLSLWESMPVINPNGKYTNAGLDELVILANNRLDFITIRVEEIDDFLGNLVQGSDGNYTGSGVYLELFNVICLRISFASGTLFSSNQMLTGIAIFDKKIESGDAQLAQYEAVFALTRIMADTVIGQLSFECEDVSEFVVGDQVYVMDNSSTVYSRNIHYIIGNEIRLNSGIPLPLSVNSLARIVKQR